MNADTITEDSRHNIGGVNKLKKKKKCDVNNKRKKKMKMN